MNNAINLKVLLSNRYSLIVFIICAYIYNIIIHKSKITTIIMVFVLVYFYHLYNVSDKLHNEAFRSPVELRDEYIDKSADIDILKHSHNNFIVDNMGLYQVSHKPKEFIFLKRDKFLEQVLYDLRVIRRYDNGDYFKLMILMDKFLKIYYNLMIDRYEPRYFDHALDIRLEMINIMYNFHVDAPSSDARHQIPFTATISDAIERVQEYTMKKMKYLGNKYPNQKYKIKNPRGLSSAGKEMKDNYMIVL